MDHLCYLCLVLVMLSGLFIAALWSSCWEGLTSWLLFAMFNCTFATFPCGILGQVWYLIVSIPDPCPLSYLEPLACEEDSITAYATSCHAMSEKSKNLFGQLLK